MFPGMFGDVAMLENPSEEIYQIKNTYVYLGSTRKGEFNVPSSTNTSLAWLLCGAVMHGGENQPSRAGFKEAVLIYDFPALAC